MNSFQVFKVSASALEAQRQRMNVIASNMANVHSTRTEEGGPYRRKDAFSKQCQSNLLPTRDNLDQGLLKALLLLTLRLRHHVTRRDCSKSDSAGLRQT
jgi:flagellar basal body rod protein FlgC